jgi:Flp pilus assembly protein TadD
MQILVVKLSDLSFLSAEDLESAADIGEKILRQFAFLPGELKVIVAEGYANIEYNSPSPEKLRQASELATQASKAAQRGDNTEALELFTAALRANPFMAVARRDLAMVHYNLGKLDMAKNQLIEALRLEPNDAWSHVIMGNILTREKDWPSATRFFSKAIELKPGDPYALNGLGAVCAKRGDLAKAIEFFDAAIQAEPQMLEPQFGKAMALEDLGKLEQCADVLKSMISSQKSSPIIAHAKKLLAGVESAIREPGGPTDPELLKQKHPAAVWYLLDALKRFEKLEAREVTAITFEIARLGESGLDYASPEKKYHLTTCPGEMFSGHQLMCLMFAGFKRIAPDQDVGMDLNGPWVDALELFNSGK